MMSFKLISALAAVAPISFSALAVDGSYLPLGTWGNIQNGKPVCTKDLMIIEPKQIIVQLANGGEERCKILSLSQDGTRFYGPWKCKSNDKAHKNAPASTDEDDDNFDIGVISLTRITFSGGMMGLCPPKGK